MAFGTRYTDLDECLEDYSLWYTENQTRVTTLQDCVDFLHKAIDGRLYIIHLLREKLVALRDAYTDTSELDHALDAFTQWYASNTETVVDVMPLLSFLKRATDDSLHLLHLMRDTLDRLHIKAREDHLIYVPGARV